MWTQERTCFLRIQEAMRMRPFDSVYVDLLCSVTGALCWSLTRCARASGSSGNTRN